MLCLRAQSKILLTVLCIAVVTLRTSGAHLHLCLDGNEPAAAMHFDDEAGLHHLDDVADAAEMGAHSDRDVNLIADALVKKSDIGFDILSYFAACLLFLRLLPFVLRILPPIETLLPINAHRAHLRPLLRGPPL